MPLTSYRTGTVTVTNGSATITGVGTLWTTNVGQGHRFKLIGASVDYEINTVNSDTSITLDRAYVGTTASAQTYEIVRIWAANSLSDVSQQTGLLYQDTNSLLTQFNNFATTPNATFSYTPPGGGTTQNRPSITGLNTGIAGKANLAGGNTFTGSQSITGTVTIGSGNLLIGTTGGSNRLDIRGLNTAPTLTVNEGSTNSMVALIEEDSALGAGAQILFGSRYIGGSTIQGAAIKSSKEVSAGDGGNQYNHSLVFKTSSFPSGLQEKARITSSGYFKASNTGSYENVAATRHEFNNGQNDYVLVCASSNTGANVNSYGSFLPSGATGIHFQALVGGALVHRVLANGNVQNTNNSYGAISDRKLKQNITPAKSILAKLRKVNWVNYELISNPKLKQFGVIAQELEELFPSLIERSKDTREVTKTVTKTRTIPAVLDDEGNITEPERIEEYTEEVTEREETGEETLGVKYSVLYMLTAKALQESMDIVDKQGTMIAEQSAMIADLDQRLKKLEVQ